MPENNDASPQIDFPIRGSELAAAIQSYEKEGISAFNVYQGQLQIPDWRRLGLPMLSRSDTVQSSNDLLEQYLSYLEAHPKADLRELNVRFLWGMELPTSNITFASGVTEMLWNRSALDLFGGAKGIGLRYEDRQPDALDLEQLVDLHLEHPEQPITVLRGHGVIDTPDWNVIIDDPVTGQYRTHLPFADVREAIERRDQKEWEEHENKDSRPPSLILLSSCNNQGHVLPNQPGSIVYYSSTMIGMRYFGPASLQRTEAI